VKSTNYAEVVEAVDLKNAKSISEAANRILMMEDTEVKAGQSVACINDPTYPFEGAKGKVKSIDGGYAQVEFANGTTVPMQVSLLIPIS